MKTKNFKKKISTVVIYIIRVSGHKNTDSGLGPWRWWWGLKQGNTKLLIGVLSMAFCNTGLDKTTHFFFISNSVASV